MGNMRIGGVRNVMHVEDFDGGSIDGTGNTEASFALQDWFDTSGSGSTLVLGKNKRYRCNGQTLVNQHRSNWHLDMNGSTIFATNDGPVADGEFTRGPAIRVTGTAGINPAPEDYVRNVTVSNGFIVGSKPDGVGFSAAVFTQHGVEGIFFEGMTIQDMDIRNMRGDTFAWGLRGYSGLARNITGYEIGRQGIAITDGNDHCVENCDIRNVYRSWCDMEPGSRGVERTVIRNNTARNFQNNFIASAVGSHTEDISILNNTILSPSWLRVKVDGSLNLRWQIIGNTAGGKPGTNFALDMVDHDGLVVQYNTQPMNPDKGDPNFLAKLRGTQTNFTISNNYVPDATGWPATGQWFNANPGAYPNPGSFG